MYVVIVLIDIAFLTMMKPNTFLAQQKKPQSIIDIGRIKEKEKRLIMEIKKYKLTEEII